MHNVVVTKAHPDISHLVKKKTRKRERKEEEEMRHIQSVQAPAREKTCKDGREEPRMAFYRICRAVGEGVGKLLNKGTEYV